jgi:hypothetical protein
MREANYRLPLEGTTFYPVLYGIARGLEDLFPLADDLRLSSGEDVPRIRAERDADEAEQGM